VATLSRGYKRQSNGFILADSSSNATILGDEPFQFYSKFKNIQVAVDANRKNGIEQLLASNYKPNVILLDDAYQHRKVKAGFYILLTSYDDLYSSDYLLPTGNLREGRRGAKRANLVIVTKCPPELSIAEKNKIKKLLQLNSNQKLFFSHIEYDENIYSQNDALSVVSVLKKDKLLVAGIAKPEPFFAYLQASKDQKMIFPDHYHFEEKDIQEIKNRAKNKISITTEKDYVRLARHMEPDTLYYLPIKSTFLSETENFNQTIFDYVGASPRNR
jgi:tetraacyldisaccharide 4'-kinase